METLNVSEADNDVRYVPEENGSFGFCSIAHESRYNWVLNNWNLKDCNVLDFGCGSGYGTYELSNAASKVDGIDYSETSIDYAKSKFKSNKIRFFKMNACSSNEVFKVLSRNSYNLIVSFDVIEHLEKYFDYLNNIIDLLNKDGILIIGCPNRHQTFTWNKVWNKYHFQEFSAYQLKKILTLYFNDVHLVSQDFNDSFKKVEAISEHTGNDQKNFFDLIKRITPVFLKSIIKIFLSKKANVRKYSYLDINFVRNPSEEQLEKSFGLICICSNPKGVKV